MRAARTRGKIRGLGGSLAEAAAAAVRTVRAAGGRTEMACQASVQSHAGVLVVAARKCGGWGAAGHMGVDS